MIKNIGIISTRLQGTDGVSLETEKWVEVLHKMGYETYYFAGLSNWEKSRLYIEPLAFWEHPKIDEIQSKCFASFKRPMDITEKIHKTTSIIKKSLYKFIEKFNIDLIIVENALAIPMNIPLGIAVTELIAETMIPTIAHNHDFHWERQRFLVTCVNDYVKMAFPPSLPSVKHVVINSQADKDLSYRRGLSPYLIPNVLDFDKEPADIDDYSKDVRKDLGLKDDDLFFLQPTRVIARKGIEHSIEIINRMKNDKAKLVITHQSKDEGKDYLKRIISYAKLLNVELIIKPDIIGKERGITKDGKKIYTLWDIYPHADFITYPSTYEGFGNAFLEALYFKKPILVNRYSIYKRDIEPLGFDVVTMDTYINDDVVKKINEILSDKQKRRQMVEKNFDLCKKFYSYDVLEQSLKTILIYFEGFKNGS